MRHLITQHTCYYLAILLLVHTKTSQSFTIFKQKTNAKQSFIQSLHKEDPNKIQVLNDITKERTKALSNLIQTNPTTNPGSTKSFSNIAPGVWKIIYAPHIKTFNNILTNIFPSNNVLRGFDPVVYDLKSIEDGKGVIISHAKYNNIPFLGSGWLSVSGTYSSQDGENVCRVDFNHAWYKPKDEIPYPTIESVPSSLTKEIIDTLGRLFFIDVVSIFPVSYLDNDLIVFDFDLLGTRICASKNVN